MDPRQTKLRVELMPWEAARAHASAIRFAVFVEEQGVPREIELDEMDGKSVHAVAFEDHLAVGTARLLPDGHLGRMAVLKAWRRRGIGSVLLGALIEAAARQGHARVALSAQVHAVPFYRAHGFVPHGGEYLEAGIAHQGMQRRL